MGKYEWWDVCRSLRPDLTWQEFERMWDEFVVLKQRRTLQ